MTSNFSKAISLPTVQLTEDEYNKSPTHEILLKLGQNSVGREFVKKRRRNICAALSYQHQIFDDISVIGLGGIDTTTAWVQSIYYPNDGPIHTDTWFRWRATGKISGKLIEFPCHLVFEWEDNKIIKEWHYYDGSQMLDEIALANK